MNFVDFSQVIMGRLVYVIFGLSIVCTDENSMLFTKGCFYIGHKIGATQSCLKQ